MVRIVLVLLMGCSLVVLGFQMGALFAISNNDVYDYDDLMRAYSAGFESGRKAGGWTRDGEDE